MGEPVDEPGNNGVRITQREIYDAVIALKAQVADLDRRWASTIEQGTVLNQRIRSLELKVYALLAGLIAALGVLVFGKLPPGV